MTLIKKFKGCIGIKLWKFGRRHGELWFIPKGTVMPEHCHIEQSIELIFLWGKAKFMRREHIGEEQQSVDVVFPYSFLQMLTIPPGWWHSFISSETLVFINSATFKENYKPKSATKDFIYAN